MKIPTKQFFGLTFLAVAWGLNLPLAASTIVEVRALTDRILVVHYDDGYVNHHRNGQTSDDDVVVVSPLNLAEATQLGNYALSSLNDPAYSTNTRPVDLGRKSKGTDFAGFCQGWGYLPYFNTIGCINGPDHAKEHWLYLYLPTPLRAGAQYELRYRNAVITSLTFDPKANRSEAVHVNQVGYSTKAPAKYGYVYHWAGDKGGVDLAAYTGSTFWLIDQPTGTVAFTGRLAFRKDRRSDETQWDETPERNFLGADVYECDFSTFTRPGQYTLAVDGIGTSFPFTINCDAFTDPFRAVMSGIYQNRSGTVLAAPFTTQPRPAPHHVRLTPGFAGRLVYTTTQWCEVSNSDASPADKPLWERGIRGELTDTWGWYQDAGDWDAYLGHLQVPTLLMFLYENFTVNFTDGQLNLPESGNNLPDVLDEARWLIRFYKRLRDELGRRNWGTGGVGGARIMGDLWGSDSGQGGAGRGSWQDNDRTWVVSGEDAFVTFWYAAIAAHYASCLQKAGQPDPEGIDWRTEATTAYAWAQANLPASNTCHFANLRHLRMYAAASLYKLTAITSYNAQFVSDFNAQGVDVNFNELTDQLSYGPWQYATLPATTAADPAVLAKIRGAATSTADLQLNFLTDNRACRWGGNPWMPMLVGQATTPLIQEGVMGYVLSQGSNPAQATQYWQTIHNTADYFMGNNPLNTTWITGLGHRSPTGVFHLDSWFGPSGQTRPGIVPYGPWRKETSASYGPWRNEWTELTVYPAIEEWPGHERWFDQRTSPLACEFTIYQTNLKSAFVYGALMGEANCDLKILNVEMIYLEANALPNGNELRWATASEQQNKAFVVERSLDGERFVPIGTVAGRGTTHQRQQYRFLDPEPPSEAYYQLRQTDHDGQVSLSRVVQVKRAAEVSLSLYPNPATGFVNLKGPGPLAWVVVKDMLGRVVKTVAAPEPLLHLHGLVKGLYWVEAKPIGQGKSLKAKLIVE
jgi:endoglucanase